MSEDELHQLIQPHLDAIRLFSQQVGTEPSVAEADLRMVMAHVQSLIDIAKQLDDGPERKALVSLLDSFSQLSTMFRFVPEDEDEDEDELPPAERDGGSEKS